MRQGETDPPAVARPADDERRQQVQPEESLEGEEPGCVVDRARRLGAAQRFEDRADGKHHAHHQQKHNRQLERTESLDPEFHGVLPWEPEDPVSPRPAMISHRTGRSLPPGRAGAASGFGWAGASHSEATEWGFARFRGIGRVQAMSPALFLGSCLRAGPARQRPAVRAPGARAIEGAVLGACWCRFISALSPPSISAPSRCSSAPTPRPRRPPRASSSTKRCATCRCSRPPRSPPPGRRTRTPSPAPWR